MFASSLPGLQYTQSFLKQCFSNSKSCSKGKCIAWGSGVGCAVQVGGAVILFCLVFLQFGSWFFILSSACIFLLFGRVLVLFFFKVE